jgi:hypothetical protein
MTTATVNEMARGVVESADAGRLVLRIPQTDYRLHLVPTGPINVDPGKRIKGVIHAKALRLFATQGGGKFIEPVIGEPRIVAGMVLAVDALARRVLVDVAVPMWMTLDDRQPKLEVSVGELVNCYVESGMTFTPA